MRTVTRHNVVKQSSFSERLAELMRKYINQNLTAAQIIAELVALAKEVPPTPAAAANSPAAQHRRTCLLRRGGPERVRRHRDGRHVLADIARDLVRPCAMRNHRLVIPRRRAAKIRSTIKRLLAKYGYPPDAERRRHRAVLHQMETFADEWSPEA